MHQLTRYREWVPTWVGALARYDAEIAAHSTRVAQAATELAREVGCADDVVELAGCAGLLHDIGKLRVARPILTKAGPLTADDWVSVRRHPANGAKIIALMPDWLAPVAEGVRTHHERWDGSGYPDGLRGDAIPLLGRIVAIVDVFDALTHSRCYREWVFTEKEALHQIETGAGRFFDPGLVAAFVRLERSQ